MPLSSGGKLCDKHKNNIAKMPLQSTMDKNRFLNNHDYYCAYMIIPMRMIEIAPAYE